MTAPRPNEGIGFLPLMFAVTFSFILGKASSNSVTKKYLPEINCTMVGDIRQAYWGRPDAMKKLTNGNYLITTEGESFECENLTEFNH
jgi:hypothetical protein